jgi:sn-glycerol 3-phosphate transport system permease protein
MRTDARTELRWHAVLLVTGLAVSFPLIWALLTSFRPPNAIFEIGPTPVSVANYVDALALFPIGRLLLNSVVTALGVTAAQLLVAVLAAYAMLSLGVRSQRLVLGAVTVSMVVPLQAMVIPQFLIATGLGWRDTYAGLIVPQLASCGLAVLLMWEHVRSIPKNLIGAAAIDGARPGETLWHVVLPQLRPGLCAVGILVFVTTWNEYLWPALVAPSPENTTIQQGLALFNNQEGGNPGPLLAASVLSCAPVIAVYAVFSRRITAAFLQAGRR